MKLMELKEFQEEGYLQEVNRCFLHRLGMALVFREDKETGQVTFHGIWDARDDPEGIRFDELDRNKSQKVRTELMAKDEIRISAFGETIQTK